jgi:EAL domain-containing protein (putative c-di-GMP-specific phosphodiesterase class I)
VAIPRLARTRRRELSSPGILEQALARLTGFEMSSRADSALPEADLASAYLFTTGIGIVVFLAVSLVLGAGDRTLLACLLGIVLLGVGSWIFASRVANHRWTAGVILTALIGWPLLVVAVALASRTDATYGHATAAVMAIIVATSLSVVLQMRVAIVWLLGQICLLAVALSLIGHLGGARWIELLGVASAGVLGLVGRFMLDRLAMARDRLTELMHTLEPGSSLEDTAQSIVREVAEAGCFDVVLLGAFLPDGRLRHLAQESGLPRELPLALGSYVDEARAAYVRSRVYDGPWISDWDANEASGYDLRMYEAGVRITLHAPIVHDRAVVGVLVVGYGAGSGGGGLHRRAKMYGLLPSVVEAASLIGSILAPELAALDDRSMERLALRSVIESGGFSPVFQPIVELRSGAVVGYEALTRFASGERPDFVFETASRIGLGPELELATLGAALAASDRLEPPSAYLSINLSPELVLSGCAASLLGRLNRPVTVELTEHAPVEDYVALRAAVRAFGPGVRLAVDDAGAGFASLRHVLELRPDVVKLDIGLVRGIDSDPARQALVAGMVHFSERGNFRLVAEGVETKAELKALLGLRVGFGQGYLFGRAEPVSDSTHQQRDVA